MEKNRGNALALPITEVWSVAVLLLAMSWLAAELAPNLVQTYSLRPTWVVILGGLLPWLLQLITVAALLGSTLRRHRDRAAVRFATAVTTVIGASWWGGATYSVRGSDQYDVVLSVVGDTIIRYFEGESLGYCLTHRVCGPVISIPDLAGPLTLGGSTFFSTLISLVCVMAWLCFVAIRAHGQPSAPRLAGWIALSAAIYIPSFIGSL